jgi:hypothetical protein
MALACHQQLVSLGEVFQVIRKPADYWLIDNKDNCSCGKSAAECEFWSKALGRIKSLPIETSGQAKYQHIPAAYNIVLDTFQELYGDNMFPVDTSKGTRHLDFIAKDKGIDPNVLFLLRDVRSFSNSQTRLAKSQNRTGLRKLKNTHWFQLLKWYFGNKKRENMLCDNHIKYHTVGYETFCFKTNQTLSTAYSQLKLAPFQQGQDIQQSQHHVLFGNPIRLDQSKQQRIEYDARWLKDNGYIVPLALMPFVRHYNKNKVYGNDVDL